MTQPSFVPIAEADQVRPARRLAVPKTWAPNRPAEVSTPARATGRGLGTPGPDQGFAMRLAHRFHDRLHLEAGEHEHDVIEGSALVASKRAGLFGRAPSVHDLTVAFTVFGFLADAPAALKERRRTLFSAVGHSYPAQRRLVDSVPEATLRLSPDEVATQARADWASLLNPAP